MRVIEDYNQGKGDPSRLVAKLERRSRKMKDIKKHLFKKTIALISNL